MGYIRFWSHNYTLSISTQQLCLVKEKWKDRMVIWLVADASCLLRHLQLESLQYYMLKWFCIWEKGTNILGKIGEMLITKGQKYNLAIISTSPIFLIFPSISSSSFVPQAIAHKNVGGNASISLPHFHMLHTVQYLNSYKL